MKNLKNYFLVKRGFNGIFRVRPRGTNICNNQWKPAVIKPRLKKFLLGFLLVGIAFLYTFHPTPLLKIYKALFVKYVRITQGDFNNRFSDKELTAAILHAKSEDWVQSQIRSDLAPFKQGINRAQLAVWFKSLQHIPGNKLAKFTVKDAKVAVEVPAELTGSRQYKTVNSVIRLLAAKRHIPDCEFIVALNDYLAFVPKGMTTSVPILSFAKHTKISVEKDTILIPDWMNVRYWDVLRSRIALASQLYPWKSKKNLIHWRGGCADSMNHRRQLMNLAPRCQFLDVGMVEGPNAVDRIDPEESVEYKYQISLDGARCTWERMVWQMYANTVLIKPDSPQEQWFHRGLKPFKNYIPLVAVDEKNITAVYTWLQEHDKEAQEISRNANQFAKDNFKTEDFFAYYALLLQSYSKLLK